MSKGKIVLIVIVAYFVIFAIINVNKEKNINKIILDKVTYVTDGKIDKKNDGKLVLVTGKIGYDELVSFIELDDDFGTIKISRKVEDYLKDEDNEYGWIERKEPLTKDSDDYLDKIVSEEKIAKISIGEYTLDKKGLELIPANKYYSKQEYIGELFTTGIDYSKDPYEENLKEGDMKITYKYYDLDKNPYISILATQKGDSFEPYKVDNKESVYQLFVGKIDSEKKLSKQLKINVKKTIKGKTLFILMIVGLGIFLIVDNNKGKVKNEK